MAKYKIGITEAGDAGLDLSWADRRDEVDGVVLVTKEIAPDFRKLALIDSHKIIIHATTTGYGGTILEPNVPQYEENISAAAALVKSGFPHDHIVIRIDPIIPTPKGLYRAYNVFKAALGAGFNRFRVSIIDMYPHVRERFKEAGLPLPYPDGVFSPSNEQVQAVDDMLMNVYAYAGECPVWIECCCGCISNKDLKLLGLDMDDDGVGYQRKHCMCYSGKTELLKNKHRCSHGCLYCFWK